MAAAFTERRLSMKATIILAVIFVFTLLVGAPVSAGAEEATLGVGDTHAGTYGEEGAGDAEGDQTKKDKKGKKGKKNGKKKNGKKKNGKKAKPVEETE
jgi:hypothetical protein